MGKVEEDVSFEEAMEQLEEMVDSLEAGALGLEESLKTFEKGMSLVRMCQKKLEDAETKIAKLVKNKDGSLVTEPFQIEDES
jgi:exodeoxyribonuclease VII small subunit